MVFAQLIFASLVFVSSEARAFADFDQTVVRIQKDCAQLEMCSAHNVNVSLVYSVDEGVEGILASDVIDTLQSVAQKQAHVWADTILEGDYFADRAVTLSAVEEIKLDGRTFGYRITYSAKAWRTNTCNYREEDLDSLRSCQLGRISEKSFVSADLSQWLQDAHAYAEFY